MIFKRRQVSEDTAARKVAEEKAARYHESFTEARNSENRWKAQMFHTWRVIAAQQKGLNRQRRLIKRLQAQLVEERCTTKIRQRETPPPL